MAVNFRGETGVWTDLGVQTRCHPSTQISQRARVHRPEDIRGDSK